MRTFKQPLSEEEEAYYIRMYLEGEKEASEEARQILIERNLRLVAHIAKKYQNVDESPEDLISSAVSAAEDILRDADGKTAKKRSAFGSFDTEESGDRSEAERELLKALQSLR